MALDLADGNRGSWFGSSPAVVVVAVTALLAAGGGFWASRGDSYVEALTAMCKQAETQMLADASARAAPTFAPIDFGNTVFHHIEASVAQRLALLQGVRAPSDRAGTHAKLVAGEQSVLALAGGFAREVEQTRSIRGVLGQAQRVVWALREQDAKYGALGVPKGCAD